jgi:hypothetical protein
LLRFENIEAISDASFWYASVTEQLEGLEGAVKQQLATQEMTGRQEAEG